ncbi:hypothetical protein ACIBG4_09425 [Nonomuraea sp. NPDC050383]|uniref:hypothetical protein n=1 Tax=Nonomuraea sp. NPDC050383 TaxID=3364362 RepID=UPI0037A30CA1
MTNQHESIPDLMQEDTFEVVMRGYNRRQVHDYMTRTRNQIRDLEERLARAIEQAEQGRVELAEARRRMVEAPQSYEDLSPRLAQILKLGEEEAAAKRADAEAESTQLREQAAEEAERLVSSARATADEILTSAQAEAERRVTDATAAAEGMLAQAGSDAEEQLTTARTEADETLRSARAEAERLVTGAEQEAARLLESASAEADRTLAAARGEAESTLADANRRVAALDEHAGRRVEYLTNTHSEVVRRLSEIGSVLGDLMRTESAAGALVLEQAGPAREPVPAPEESREPAPVESTAVESAPVESAPVEHAPVEHAPVGQAPVEHVPAQQEPEAVGPLLGAPREPVDQDDVRVIVQDDEPRPGTPNAPRVSDDTDVNLGRLSDLRQ